MHKILNKIQRDIVEAAENATDYHMTDDDTFQWTEDDIDDILHEVRAAILNVLEGK